MKLNAPTKPVFLISLVLLILALVGHFAQVSVLWEHQLWFAVAAYASLAFGCLLKGK